MIASSCAYANSMLDVDPESHDPFAHTPDSDSELEGDNEEFTGREHYETVGYIHTASHCFEALILTPLQQEQATQAPTANSRKAI